AHLPPGLPELVQRRKPRRLPGAGAAGESLGPPELDRLAEDPADPRARPGQVAGDPEQRVRLLARPPQRLLGIEAVERLQVQAVRGLVELTDELDAGMHGVLLRELRPRRLSRRCAFAPLRAIEDHP